LRPETRSSQLAELDQWARGLVALDVDPGYTAGYTPSPKQQLLHASLALNLLYGGAAGGGKSRGFREDIRRFCLSPEAAGQNVLLLRRTHIELRDNHWQPAMLEWHADGAKFNASEKVVTWPNGARVIMGHCHTDADVMRYLGQEYARVYFDELTTFTETMYDMVCSRLRTTRPDLIPRAIAGTNPGGVGHLWVKSRWLDGRAVKSDGTPVDLTGYAFIQAKLSDNPIVDTPAYRARLDALPPAKRKAYLEGAWDIFEGQYFPEWSADLHVCEPFAIPDGWPRWRATDYGGSAPWCTGWGAMDPDTKRIYVYREHYQAGALLRANCEHVIHLSGQERYKASMGDPSMWAKGPDEAGSLADQCRQHGFQMSPAYNPRLPGWQVVHECLRADAGPPRLQVFSTCHNLIRTLPGLIFDARQVEDLDTDGEDHAADMLRYLLCEIVGKRRIDKPVHGGDRSAMLARSAYG